MQVYDILQKKRDGQALSREEIDFFIRGISADKIEDYQASAFLMAAYIQGLSTKETALLTRAMMESGDILDLSDISPDTVDKHSTGGVGDKVSLILAPAVAACGAIVPMMSGRGLGHTGGTLDKLESIPGYRVGLSEEEFRAALRENGIAIIGQTGDLAPADKKLYGLRDVTATVDSIPLITASIMSKKFAAGPASIVMDVKWGSGAFMQTVEDARQLARSLVEVGKQMERQVTALITDMNQPLGHMVGNALEIYETVLCLQGQGPEDVMEICRNLAGEMLDAAGIASSTSEGRERFDKAIEDGSALKKFKDMVQTQNGDVSVLDNPEKLLQAPNRTNITAEQGGYIGSMDSIAIGKAVISLGGGRLRSGEEIDHRVGIEVIRKTGDPVKAGEPIAVLHSSDNEKAGEAAALYKRAVSIQETAPQKTPLIVETIS